MYLSGLRSLSTASDIELFRITREWAIPIDFLYKCSTCLFVFHAISLRSQVEVAEMEMSNGELGFEPFLTQLLDYKSFEPRSKSPPPPTSLACQL